MTVTISMHYVMQQPQDLNFWQFSSASRISIKVRGFFALPDFFIVKPSPI